MFNFYAIVKNAFDVVVRYASLAVKVKMNTVYEATEYWCLRVKHLQTKLELPPFFLKSLEMAIIVKHW